MFIAFGSEQGLNHITLSRICDWQRSHLWLVILWQGYSPTGAQSPQIAKIFYSWVTKISNKEHTGLPKTCNSYRNSIHAYFQGRDGWQNSLLILCIWSKNVQHSLTWLCSSTVGKTFLEIQDLNESSFEHFFFKFIDWWAPRKMAVAPTFLF